jgi:glutamyl/glutaminyl-tRNA synthetase
MKADGTFLYTFTSVIDDIDSSITHVIRGQDHVTNTAAQITMFEALAEGAPEFAHLSLFVNKDGSQFSNRLGSANLDDIRRCGIDPMAVSCALATLGSSMDPAPFLSMEELAGYFDISKFSTNSPKFDVENIASLNKKIMHMLSYEDVKNRLGSEFIMAPATFEVIKNNIENYEDIKNWEKILSLDFVSQAQFSKNERQILEACTICIKNYDACKVANTTYDTGNMAFNKARVAYDEANDAFGEADFAHKRAVADFDVATALWNDATAYAEAGHAYEKMRATREKLSTTSKTTATSDNCKIDDFSKAMSDFLESVKEMSGASGKALYAPIRKALTGLEHGPNLAELLNILGKAEVKRRIARCLE